MHGVLRDFCCCRSNFVDSVRRLSQIEFLAKEELKVTECVAG